MYISLSLKPGYKAHMLKRHGFGGEYELFQGNVAFTNDKTFVTWDGGNYPMKGIYICVFVFHSVHGRDMIYSLDILNNTKFDMSNVFLGMKQSSFIMKDGQEELEDTFLPAAAMRANLFHLDVVILQLLNAECSLRGAFLAFQCVFMT